MNWDGNSFSFQPQQPKTAFDTYPGATANWGFTDAGELGKNDRAQIVIKNSLGATVLTVSGNLNKGNQQAH